MSRLTRNEIKRLHHQLFEWQAPAAMLNVVARINSPTYFCQSGLAFLRDAWIGAEFARLRNAESVRLIDDQWPDFEMRNAGIVERFEAVEADDPERRRSEEYREDAARVTFGRLENYREIADQVPTWLSVACAKKVAKHYARGANLAIYLNYGDFGTRQKETEGCFLSATSLAKGSFSNVWVLWKNKAYHVWQHGKACEMMS